MERRIGRKLRGLLVAAMFSLLVGAAAHSAPVRADCGSVGCPPPEGIVVIG
jgi:hypothetical protein